MSNMNDMNKTKEQLINELQKMRRRFAKFNPIKRQKKPKVEKSMKSEEDLYDLVENAGDLIQSVTPDGRFLYVNRSWREMLGYSEDEVAKLTLFDIIHPDCHTHCRKIFQQVLSGEEVGRVEVNFVTKEGKKIAVEGKANCRFQNGKPTATRGIFRDVTEQKKKEYTGIMQGESELLKVPELLQICAFFIPDEAYIFVTTPDSKAGRIYIANGEIIHAETEKVSGKKALIRMLGWKTRIYKIDKKSYTGKPTVSESLENYLIDSASQLDEYNNLRKNLDMIGNLLEVQYKPELMNREYDSITAEVLSLIITHREVDKILDESPYTDLETIRVIKDLLSTGIIKAYPQQQKPGN